MNARMVRIEMDAWGTRHPVFEWGLELQYLAFDYGVEGVGESPLFVIRVTISYVTCIMIIPERFG